MDFPSSTSMPNFKLQNYSRDGWPRICDINWHKHATLRGKTRKKIENIASSVVACHNGLVVVLQAKDQELPSPPPMFSILFVHAFPVGEITTGGFRWVWLGMHGR